MKQFYQSTKAFLVLIFLSISIISSHISMAAPTSTWQLLQEKDGVKVYYMSGSCTSQDVVYLKFQNTNPSSKTLIWTASIQSGNNLIWLIPSTNAPKNINSLEVLEGNCSTISTGFTITSLNVSEINNLTLNLIVKP